MRITMVAPFGLEPKGTTRWRVLPLARAVAGLGADVTVIVPSWDSPQAGGRRWRKGGAQVVLLPVPRLGGRVLSASLLARVVGAMERSAADLVHAFKPIGYSGFAGAWARRRGMTACVDTDDWEGRGGWSDASPQSGVRRRLIRAQERRVLRGAAHVTVASHALVECAADMGVSRDRVTLLPNTSSLRYVECEREDASAVVYTRFVEVSPTQLVALWERIAARAPAARLLVIGAGLHGEERELARLAQQRELSSLWVEGQVLPGRLPELLATRSVALFPCDDTLINRTKCSVRLVDLVALGLPVVAHAVGECAHYVEDGVTGLLARPGDDEAFVGSAVRLLVDSPAARRMGRAARTRFLERFSPQRVGAALADLYAGLAGPPAVSGSRARQDDGALAAATVGSEETGAV